MDMALDQSSQISDAELLARYAQGDAQAAGVLTARLSPQVLGFSMRLLGDRGEAEDVVQEAFLRLWRMAPEWQEGQAKLSTWLVGVAKNLCIDRLRKRRSIGLGEISEPQDDTPSVEAQMFASQRAKALDDALSRLPERQRIAVILRHIEGMANPEIAEVLEISTEAVESLTARGKRALSADLSARKEELGL
jgi:RNA polymerase sigma-70 factor (ECF subfamily)